MAGINIVDEVKITDGTNDVEVDQYSKALNVIDSVHKQIHDGVGFTYTKDFIIEANSEEILYIKNPTLNFPHLRVYAVEVTGSPGEVCLFKDTTASDDGDSQIVFNNNLASANSANLAIYTNPTITDIGNEIDCDIISGSKFGGGTAVPFFKEWILNQSENYAIKYENKSGIAIDVNMHVFWYE